MWPLPRPWRSTIHFYNLKSSLSSPQMMVVAEVRPAPGEARTAAASAAGPRLGYPTRRTRDLSTPGHARLLARRPRVPLRPCPFLWTPSPHQVDDPFVPVPDDLLVNLRESRALVDSLLDSLPQSYSRAGQVGQAGPAIWADARAAGEQPASMRGPPNSPLSL